MDIYTTIRVHAHVDSKYGMRSIGSGNKELDEDILPVVFTWNLKIQTTADGGQSVFAINVNGDVG